MKEHRAKLISGLPGLRFEVEDFTHTALLLGGRKREGEHLGAVD